MAKEDYPKRVGVSQVALVVKSLPASAGASGTRAQSLGGEDPPEEGMTAQSSILTWRIPWTEEPGGLWSLGLHSQTQLEQLSTHAKLGVLQVKAGRAGLRQKEM